MSISRNQHTIAETCQVSGRGYWTGKNVTVVMHPAPAGTGIEFVRSDLPGRPSCRALASKRYDTHLRTVVQQDQARFEMIEHAMAALYGLEIDNCRIEIDGVEFPGLDGSSAAFVEALNAAGTVVQQEVRRHWVIDQVIRVQLGDRWIKAEPLSESDQHDLACHYRYKLGFDIPGPIPAQSFSFRCHPSSFCKHVARARTFVTQSQADSLRAQGVAKHVKNQDLLVFGEEGLVDNVLRYENECARHKTLDLIGDLALTGFDMVGRISSYRGGHSLNGLLAEKLVAAEFQSRQDRDQDDERQAA